MLIIWAVLGVLVVGGTAVDVAASGKPGIVVLGVALLALIAILATRGASWANLARATYTDNQLFVQVNAAPEFAAAVSSSAAVAAAPQPQQQPLQWFKPLKPVWIIALLIGLLGLVGGGFQLISGGPICGSDVMTEGDVCVTEHYNRNRADDVSSYDREVAQLYFFTIAGALLTIVGGAMTVNNKLGNRRRHAAFLAAQK